MVFTLMFETLIQNLMPIKTIKHHLLKQFDFFKIKYQSLWDTVIDEGKTIRVEPIGNHNRGTKFVNANLLITPKLVAVVDEIVKHIPGFYYGRIDLKAQSIGKLLNGEEIRVLEFNGVNSEPTHI